VIDRMIATFRRLHGLADGGLHADELVRATELAHTRFATPQWTADVA